MATEPTTPTTNRCCELCRAVGHQGKIDTPWCGKMGNCPCHTNRCCELCLGDENTECRFKAGNPPPFCPCHTNRCCADCEEVGKFRGEWYCTNPFCKCHSQKGERIEELDRIVEGEGMESYSRLPNAAEMKDNEWHPDATPLDVAAFIASTLAEEKKRHEQSLKQALELAVNTNLTAYDNGVAAEKKRVVGILEHDLNDFAAKYSLDRPIPPAELRKFFDDIIHKITGGDA